MLLAAYNAALPGLWAEEQLAALAVAQAGAGLMAEDERREMVTSLRRTALGASHAGPAERPGSLDELRKGAGERGIGLRVLDDG